MSNEDVGAIYIYLYVVYLAVAVGAKHFRSDDSTNLPEYCWVPVRWTVRFCYTFTTDTNSKRMNPPEPRDRQRRQDLHDRRRRSDQRSKTVCTASRLGVIVLAVARSRVYGNANVCICDFDSLATMMTTTSAGARRFVGMASSANRRSALLLRMQPILCMG